MATIQFYNDYGWNKLPPTISSLNAETVIQRLSAMRQEWEAVTQSKGGELIRVNASLGLALSDFCDILNFTPEQRVQALGPDLAEATRE